ncbi:MAG: RdgB/HAM1 family non-canonical purine NTP pyrophosphatase [Chloroflexota bacterium]|nr:RdgB/HAM1 family non-canonical purine NTP pyrophosphatase [Chloroflexota bacterium]
MPPLLIATKNPHKVQEYRELLAGLRYTLRSLNDLGIEEDVEEAGDSFEANARLKAERYAELSGLLTLADDSGLEVDALGGEPGVQSRRWAGERVTDAERNQSLLERLQDVPEGRRTARFRCAIAIAEPGRPTLVVEGRCAGSIASEPRGSHGFGYDPVFFVSELGQTLGQAPAAVKNRVSHRARAARAARAALQERSGAG